MAVSISRAWLLLSSPHNNSTRLIAALLKIDPVAGAVVNTQLAYTLANRLNVTQKAVDYPEDPRSNDRLCAVILELRSHVMNVAVCLIVFIGPM